MSDTWKVDDLDAEASHGPGGERAGRPPRDRQGPGGVGQDALGGLDQPEVVLETDGAVVTQFEVGAAGVGPVTGLHSGDFFPASALMTDDVESAG